MAAETRLSGREERSRLRDAIHRTSLQLLDGAADEILLLPPRSIPKTSSGKLRRGACRLLYERGELGRTLPPWRQFIRLTWPALRSRAERAGRSLAGRLYGIYVWSVALALTPLFALGVAVLPGLPLRLAYGRGVLRIAFALAGIPIEVADQRRERVRGPSIIVANHSSYLDVPALATALRGKFRLVAKREFTANRVLKYFFGRLGCIFVERTEAQRAIEDSRAIEEAVRGGETIVLFPEGTFRSQPGLLPFRMGAFWIAARTRAPVIPIAIRGTRSILHPEHRLPRRGPIRITIFPPLPPEAGDWNEALRLRQTARDRILSASGEPALRE